MIKLKKIYLFLNVVLISCVSCMSSKPRGMANLYNHHTSFLTPTSPRNKVIPLSFLSSNAKQSFPLDLRANPTSDDLSEKRDIDSDTFSNLKAKFQSFFQKKKSKSQEEQSIRTIKKVVQFNVGGATAFGGATNLLVSYINKKIMPEQEMEDDNDDDHSSVKIKVHERLGRLSIQYVLLFIAIGTFTSFLPSMELPYFLKKWYTGIKSCFHKILINSYIFTAPPSSTLNTNSQSIVLTVPCQYILFIITSIESIYAIITDKSAMGKYDGQSALSVAGFLYILKTYLFPPRYLFILGAGLRMIQLCTNFKNVFDPSVGVCALVNLGAIFGSAKWISKIVLGWTVSPFVWRVFGARAP